MTESRAERIETLLKSAFEPTDFLLKDQSHLHAGHAGAEDGRSHFAVRIVSERFAGLSRIQRHREIYGALGDMMQTDIHALSIDAHTPDETSRT